MEAAVSHPSFKGMIGVARRDITPPAGIYARNWGSALHEAADGVHRPLTATVITLAEVQDDIAQPFVLVSMDLGWWRSIDDESYFREPILSELGLDHSKLMIHLTHTHAGPSLSLQTEQKTGGDKVRPYLLSVQCAVVSAIREALAKSFLGTVSWHSGRCNLACHRDLVVSDIGPVVGYAPQLKCDGTVLVGRVTDESGATRATLVNYACHPTTLGGGNRLISPDYAGAMREIIEQATDAAPCLFLQGASGELAPRRQYSDRTEVADQNGRQLGFAVLATLADMFPHGQELHFSHVEDSTTRLGCWELVACVPNTKAAAQKLQLELPLKQSSRPSELTMPTLETSTAKERATIERIERLIHRWNGFEEGDAAVLSIWLWQLGGAVLVGVPAEMHSAFQLELRRQFNGNAIVVVNLVNGCYGYLPPMADFSEPTYQCDATLFQPGAHEAVVECCVNAIERVTAHASNDESFTRHHAPILTSTKTTQGESR